MMTGMGEPVPVIAVVGGGHGAVATAGDLASRGFTVRLSLRNRARFARLFESRRITLSGALEAEGELEMVTDDPAQAVAGAGVILMPAPATIQAALARAMAPGLGPANRLLVMMPGNLGTVAIARVFHELGVRHQLAMAETATLPYGVRTDGQASARLAMVAHHNPTGVYPATAIDAVLPLLRRLYPGVEPAEDVLDAATLNSNGSLHAPLVLLNAGPIEAGPYDIHREGTQPVVRRVIQALEGERIRIREALGYHGAHWPLDDYYANRDWFYGPGAFDRVQAGSVWREQLAFEHRYLDEDVGTGLVLLESLARRLGIATPLVTACIELASAVRGLDLRAGGRSLDNLGLDQPAPELRHRLRTGGLEGRPSLGRPTVL